MPFAPNDALRAADSAFAHDSEARGADAWADVWAEQGVLDRGGDPPAIGPEAVRAAVAGAAAVLRWEPIASGELWPDSLGYTVGRHWMVDGGGAPAGDTARYVTVWQRTDEGWKVAFDAALPADGTAPGADAFDFWLGDWNVAQRIWSGESDDFEEFTGRTRVRGIEQGGALVESYDAEARFFWLGMEQPRRVRAASVRLWDPARSEWRIYWMDSVGGAFDRPFRGSFVGGEGVFEVVDEAAGRTRRIVFRPVSEDAVDWELEVRSTGADAGQSLWTIAFRR
jgi:ketosteroid isomerase-like protein